MKRYILLLLLIVIGTSFIFRTQIVNYVLPDKQLLNAEIQHLESKTSDIFSKLNENRNTTPEKKEVITDFDVINIPESKTLPGNYHIFQTFNNCGPASLSMALFYYGINVDQKTLGQELRPYQNARGDNDDKSVTLSELGDKAREYGFIPIHRPNGDFNIMQQFIAADMPIITRTWLKENEDIGHYRVVKGYNKKNNTIIQDDSLQGKNITYNEEEFDVIWKKFNYEYLILVPEEKLEVAKQILGKNYDENYAWTKAVENAQEMLQENPNDIYARFNLAVAYYHIGEYNKTIDEYEKVATELSFRTLWYQIEPILAYYKLGKYDRVFSITDLILNNHNRAFSELYIIRGDIYFERGDLEKAKLEYEKAVYYNKSLKVAQEALDKVQ